MPYVDATSYRTHCTLSTDGGERYAKRANELKILHDALEAFIESGASGLQDCKCRLDIDRVHKILSSGYRSTPAFPGASCLAEEVNGGRKAVAGS